MGTVLGSENTWGDGCVRETGGALSLWEVMVQELFEESSLTGVCHLTYQQVGMGGRERCLTGWTLVSYWRWLYPGGR